MRIMGRLRGFSSEGIDGLFAHQYDSFALSPAMMDHYRHIATEVASRVDSGRILEIGPGPGMIAIEIAKLLPKAEVVGLDVSRTIRNRSRSSIRYIRCWRRGVRLLSATCAATPPRS